MAVLIENTSTKKLHRRGWIDYARGFVIIYVVYRHAITGLISAGANLKNAIYLVQEASMPVFFIVSGIFIGSSALKRGLPEFIKFKFNSLLYIYFIWGFIHLTIQLLFSNYSNSDKSTTYYLYLFIAPRAIDQFWYLYTLFFVMIIFAALNFSVLKFKVVPNVLVAVVFYFLASFIATLWFSLSDILTYYLFLVFGFLMSKVILPVDSNFFKGKWLLYIIPLFVLLQVFWWSHYSDIRYLSQLDLIGFILFAPITIIGAVLLFLLSHKLDEWNALKFLKYIGSHSLYIYIMHLIFTAAIRILIMKLAPGLSPIIMLMLVIAGGVFIPMGCYQLLIKMKLNILFEPPWVIAKSGSSDDKSQ